MCHCVLYGWIGAVWRGASCCLVFSPALCLSGTIWCRAPLYWGTHFNIKRVPSHTHTVFQMHTNSFEFHALLGYSRNVHYGVLIFVALFFFAWKQSKGATLKRNGGCRLPCRSKPSQHLVTISVTGLCQSSVQCKNIMEEAEQAPSNHLLSISRHHGVQCHRH